MDNPAGLSPTALAHMRAVFLRRARQVYALYQMRCWLPIHVVLTRALSVAFYRGDRLLLPVYEPHDDRWMEEDYIHELAHHVTGRDSTFFFKEGLAVYTVEALLQREQRVPRAWPFFGTSTADWIAFYQRQRIRLPLERALTWPAFSNATARQDFRSWQVYVTAGSFCAWYAARHSLSGIMRAFREERFRQPVHELERAWLDALSSQGEGRFDPSLRFPHNRRYDRFVDFMVGARALGPGGSSRHPRSP